MNFPPSRSYANICVGDGSQVPLIRCTNCAAYDYDCTYVENAKVRSTDGVGTIILMNMEHLETWSSKIVRPFPSTYDVALSSSFSFVESLEMRVAKLQQLLGEVHTSSSHSPLFSY